MPTLGRLGKEIHLIPLVFFSQAVVHISFSERKDCIFMVHCGYITHVLFSHCTSALVLNDYQNKLRLCKILLAGWMKLLACNWGPLQPDRLVWLGVHSVRMCVCVRVRACACGWVRGSAWLVSNLPRYALLTVIGSCGYWACITRYD